MVMSRKWNVFGRISRIRDDRLVMIIMIQKMDGWKIGERSSPL